MADPGPPPKLPVLDTALAAYRSVFGYVMGPIRIALVPIAVVLAALAGGGVLVALGGEASVLAIVGFVVMVLGFVAAGVAFATAWMRYLITSGPQDPAPIGFRFGSAEWGFVGYSLLLGLVFLAIAVPGGFVIGIFGGLGGEFVFIVGVVLVYAALIYVFVRASLTFPAVAVGEQGCWSKSWRLSRGNFWRLLGAYLTIMVPYFLLELAVRAVIGNVVFGFEDQQAMAEAVRQGNWTGPVLVFLISVVIAFFAYALQYAALAQAYRNLTSGEGWMSDARDVFS